MIAPLFFALFVATFAALPKDELRKVGAPFKWANCDSPKPEWVRIVSLSVSPNPIKLGSPVTIAANVSVGSVISTASFTSVALTLETHMGVWVPIPCVDGVGSCTYSGSSICQTLSDHAAQNCPIVKPYGIPCECPFPAGTYGTPAGGVTFPTKNPGWSWLTSGDFYAKAILHLTSGEAGCIELYLSLSS